MKKRFVSLALLLAMLASLAACGEAADDANNKDDSSSATTDITDTYPAGIAPQNYEETVHFLASDWGMYKNYFFSDENSGDAMDIALFNRRMKVEEHLGVTITHEYCDGNQDQYPLVQQMVMSGDNTYQVVQTHCTYGTVSLVTEELLADFNDITTVNTDAEYWNQTANQNLAMDGHQYFAINDYMIPDPNCVLFNTNMIDSLKLEDPYELVRSGEWTIDKMMEMGAAATKDNGDGNWTVDDTYGLGAPGNWLLTPLLYSCGLKLVEQDADGYYTFAMNSEKAYSVAEKIQQLLTSRDTFNYPYRSDFSGEGGDSAQSLNMATGRCLFNFVSTSNMHVYRESTVEYGILPYPKLDTAQEEYYSIDWSGLLCIPLTAQNHDMIGEVVELLGYYSDEEVLPTYYDIVLGEKLSRDEDSKEMLGIIFDGIVYDAGMNYFGFHDNMRQFWFLPDYIMQSSWSGYASHLAKYEAGVEGEIESFNDIVSALED